MASGSEPTPPPSGSGARLPRSLGSRREVVAVVRTRGRGGKELWRGEAQESTGPIGRESSRGASLARERGRSRERTPGGSKASKRAKRPCAGEPEGLRSAVRTPCGATRAVEGRSDDRGKSRAPGPCRASVSSFTGGLQARQGRGARQKPVGQTGGLRAGEARSTSNPQGSKRPSKGGTAPREGKALKGESQGRSRHGTRLRELQGVDGATEGVNGATRARSSDAGDTAETAEELRKLEGGAGREGGTSRLTRSVESAAVGTGRLERTAS